MELFVFFVKYIQNKKLFEVWTSVVKNLIMNYINTGTKMDLSSKVGMKLEKTIY